MALTDLELDLLAQRLVPTAQKMENKILIALSKALRRMDQFFINASTNKASLSANTAYARALSEADGKYREVVFNAQKAAKKDIRRLIPEIVAQAAYKSFSGDKALWKERGGVSLSGSKPSAKLINAAQKELTRLALPATSNLGFVLKTGALEPARYAFVREIDKAVDRIATGEVTYDQVAKDAIRTLAKSGVRAVDYASGRRLNADTAVRLNVQTVCAQLSGKTTMENVRKTGVNHVEVSAHTGAREGEGHANHLGWQGQVYQVEGSSKEYPNLEAVTGYPSDPTGLYGYNCRHQMYPFWPGISEPAKWDVDTTPREYNGKAYTPTQAAAKQRAMEREIRALKREAAALDAYDKKASFAATSRKIKAMEAEYRQFSEAMNLRPKVERMQVEGYNRSVSGKATGAIKALDKAADANARIASSGKPKKRTKLPDETLKSTSPVDTPGLKGIVPKGSTLTGVEIQSGKGTSTPIRDLARLYAENPGYPIEDWQKKSGKVATDNHRYTIHWYENNGYVPGKDVKTKGVSNR